MKSSFISTPVMFALLTGSNALAQSQSEWVERFNSFQQEYRGLFEKCMPSQKSSRMFVDMANCVWRKEQILLKKHDLEHIL